ncbi:hypothetical protein H2200_001054 [Cladophialophora chaetospira]|uniref:Zn(2)-C6 fungal-type domain-containing protein n=1 Tax=Cladophialophora chaetospira TaxID=386627 RepID=A0AA39CP83_9EURO|nr:hypothetical protein H2200_001054 [Cladophialophora chaetospira]
MAQRNDEGNSNTAYRFKHSACNSCRKRKLKCNGTRPVCKTCESNSRDCEWEDILKKPGPRRGYVRSIEARLGASLFPFHRSKSDSSGTAEVESLLEQQKCTSSDKSQSATASDDTFPVSCESVERELWDCHPQDEHSFGTAAISTEPQSPQPSAGLYQDVQPIESGPPSWELSAVGLQEPLPSQQAVNELHQVFFEKIYPGVPIIHRGKYLAGMSLPATSRLRPPVCLSYAIWCLAASVSEDYSAVTEHFYHRARKYMDIDEIASRGQGVVTLAHAQTTAYLAAFETRMTYFPRAWLSIGKAVRLCHMMNLHRLDGVGLDVKEMLPTAVTWVELEERRRVFWAVFIQDRYQSVGSGWPTIIDERDITTKLPSSEEDFILGQATSRSVSMQVAMTPEGVKNLSLFAATAMIAGIFGRTVTHLHRRELFDGDQEDSENAFWRRHQYLDGVLLNTLQNLPSHLQIHSSLFNPRSVLLHINIQASTICLHQAAIFRAIPSPDKTYDMMTSKMRALGAAETMMTILRVVDPIVLANMGAWLPFCLYLAARVFVQASSDQDLLDGCKHKVSLNLLVEMLRSLKCKNPYTASLLLQLENDMALFGRSNPIGHIVVPVDDITEMLEGEKLSNALRMNRV